MCDFEFLNWKLQVQITLHCPDGVGHITLPCRNRSHYIALEEQVTLHFPGGIDHITLP